MSTVRAKLVCMSIKSWDDGNTANPKKCGEAIEFTTKYDTNDSPEDNSFSAATPSANFNMQLTNEALFGVFEEGKAYYFDITACEA
jgi:hypothetical protein